MRPIVPAFVAAALLACFDPTYRSPIACGERHGCPPDMYCHLTTLTCESTPDPGAGFDGGVDAPAVDPDGSPSDASAAVCTLYVPQTGCPAGDKCIVVPVSNAPVVTVCTPTGSGRGVDDQCLVDSECTAGTFCLGICREYCDLAAPRICSGRPGKVCSGVLSISPVGFCLPTCHPLLGLCPVEGPGLGCYVDSQGQAVCLPLPRMPPPIGGACEQVFDCGPGAGCHGGICRRYCDPTRRCSAAEACVPLPHSSHGVCIPDAVP